MGPKSKELNEVRGRQWEWAEAEKGIVGQFFFMGSGFHKILHHMRCKDDFYGGQNICTLYERSYNQETNIKCSGNSICESCRGRGWANIHNQKP